MSRTASILNIDLDSLAPDERDQRLDDMRLAVRVAEHIIQQRDGKPGRVRTQIDRGTHVTKVIAWTDHEPIVKEI